MEYDSTKKNALIILDGLGIRKEKRNNAVKLANMKNFNDLRRRYLYGELSASGESVGLLKEKMGNSEVGHLNLGAGRIVKQESKVISESIKNKSFFRNKTLKSIFKLKRKTKLHAIILLSNTGVHSLSEHLNAFLDMARIKNKKVILHLITDGRDSDIYDSLNFIKPVQEKLKKYKLGYIASVSGRYYAMDRESNWDRTKKYYDMLTKGKNLLSSDREFESIKKYIEFRHHKLETDEFIKPYIKSSNDRITKKDTVVFLNFRADRMRQIVSSFESDRFDKFSIIKNLKLRLFSLTDYSKEFTNVKPLYKKKILKNTLSDVLAKNNKKQLKIAETTKYAHVTYFFNGRKEKQNKNEKRVLIESEKVKTFDLSPKMKAKDIFFKLRKETNNENYDFILVNYANPDMVGHTGNLEATISALETVDYYLGKTVKHLKNLGYRVLITSDHGNCETMKTENGNIHTSHTNNKVPIIIVDKKLTKSAKIKNGAILSDIPNEITKFSEIKSPNEFSKKSLLEEK